jgi:hypothetical protein
VKLAGKAFEDFLALGIVGRRGLAARTRVRRDAGGAGGSTRPRRAAHVQRQARRGHRYVRVVEEALQEIATLVS